ncbi:hypothetical protein JT06_14040 [Desulfobulbus sp. Tol-SR]|nr:hypothetical protein JT06_14040 [Desulfobulbus sp. Tol-SR]
MPQTDADQYKRCGEEQEEPFSLPRRPLDAGGGQIGMDAFQGGYLALFPFLVRFFQSIEYV